MRHSLTFLTSIFIDTKKLEIIFLYFRHVPATQLPSDKDKVNFNLSNTERENFGTRSGYATSELQRQSELQFE